MWLGDIEEFLRPHKDWSRLSSVLDDNQLFLHYQRYQINVEQNNTALWTKQ